MEGAGCVMRIPVREKKNSAPLTESSKAVSTEIFS